MDLISKHDAKLQGLPRYFTGKPCNRGHISERYVKGHCVKCERLNENKRYVLLKKNNPNKLKELNLLQNIKSRAYHRAYDIRARKENPKKFRLKDRNNYLNNSKKKKQNVKIWVHNNMAHILAYNSERRAMVINRSPQWLSDLDRCEILEIYKEARKISFKTGIPHQVDHIIPLKGVNVSGLHVPSNLQVLTAVENRKKYNHFNEES